jgi:predicted nucleic acid-binding protein
LYVDSSALLERYVDEHDSDAAVELMTTDPVLLTSRIAAQTLCRSLDALHVASALRAGAATVLLTFDIRQARTARAVGLAVIGC